MTSDEIIALTPIIVPVATAVIGLFIPSPGPTVARWSSAWWSKLIGTLISGWQAKPTQALVASKIPASTQALINEAVVVEQAVAAQVILPPSIGSKEVSK